MSKTKKQNINRELLLGGTLLTLIIPLVLLMVVFTVAGVVAGSYLALAMDGFSSVGLSMVAVYGAFLLTFGWLFWRIGKRAWHLIQRKRDIIAEQERVSSLMGDIAAERRLREHDLDNQSDEYLLHQQENKTQQQ